MGMELLLQRIGKETSTPSFEKAVQRRSLEPHILRTTPGDIGYRFTDAAAFRNWWAKGRVMYTFVDDERLMALTWFSIPTEVGRLCIPATFAIRVYADLVGKGHAGSIMDRAHEAFFNETGAMATYLTVEPSNVGAYHLYKKYGYRELAVGRKITMLYER